MSGIKSENPTTASTLCNSGAGFQLPINMSVAATSGTIANGTSVVSMGTMPITATTSSTGTIVPGSAITTSPGITTTTTTRNNISVTNIKCEVDELVSTTTSHSGSSAGVTANGNIVPVVTSPTAVATYYNGGTAAHVGLGVGIRIPVTKEEAQDSDSEAELTNIENLKVTRRASSSAGSVAAGASSALDVHNKNGPRPMSWEGELSGDETTETEQMETDHSNGAVGTPTVIASTGAAGMTPLELGVSLIKSETTGTTGLGLVKPPAQHFHPSTPTALTRPTPPGARLTVQTHGTTIKPELVEQISVEIHHNNQHHQHSNHQNHNHHLNNPTHHNNHQNNHHSSSASLYAKLKLAPTQSDPINLKYEPADGATGAVNSPQLARNKSNASTTSSNTSNSTLPLPANPSPDSAIHSVYTHSSPSQSPLTSRHAPYTPSLSRNNSDASHSSCYSYSSEFSPTHSPIQGRHATPGSAVAAAAAAASSLYSSLHHAVLYRPISLDSGVGGNGSVLPTPSSSSSSMEAQNLCMDTSQSASSVSSASNSFSLSSAADGLAASAAGISRQQLINSPCPICGDKISGFHYGIFSCESCKGFFKRTVQNRKNYVCVRGGPCPVSIATRKKCPACRFEKCLQKGMKLEAIREDRTRGGRSTYQCSYTLPNSLLSPLLSPDQQITVPSSGQPQNTQQQGGHSGLLQHAGTLNGYHGASGTSQAIKSDQESPSMNGNTTTARGSVPVLLQEIMDVEHLWQYNEAELARLNQPLAASCSSSSSGSNAPSQQPQQMTNPLLASAGLGENTNPDLIAHLCNVADHRLYKIVKWCKSLPLFKNISIDDQICLLINSWCELLLFSCCFRSIDTPGEIKMSQGQTLTLAQAKSSGLQACIERMLNLTDHLRRLRVDRYEYVAMKVIVLLQSDTSELQEPVKVRECQEKALQSLQAYTLAHYPDTPSKFGELLLRIPELQRTCQLGKEMLTIRSRDGGDFNLLMELLRGEH